LAAQVHERAHTMVDGQAPSAASAVGTICYIEPDAIGVQCAQGVLRLTQLQRAGGKRLGAADFLRGFALQVGQCFE
jgi:methionyl-tRNA formyltransferase